MNCLPFLQIRGAVHIAPPPFLVLAAGGFSLIAGDIGFDQVVCSLGMQAI